MKNSSRCTSIDSSALSDGDPMKFCSSGGTPHSFSLISIIVIKTHVLTKISAPLKKLLSFSVSRFT